MALEAFLAEKGSAAMAFTLLEVVVSDILSKWVSAPNYGVRVADARDAIHASVMTGVTTGVWMMRQAHFAAICDIVEMFEQQIAAISATEVERAFLRASELLEQTSSSDA
jgi:hypothetical protein